MNWTTKNNTLDKVYDFKNFTEVVDFINEFTPICESLGHHPDFSVFDYKHIKFSLSTHDIGKVSEKDFELAKQLDEVYVKFT